MLLLIDNYDSFSYNLYQYLGELTQDIKVIRNDEKTVEEIREYCNNRMNYFNEMRRDYFEVLEEADIENILEILDKENV